MCMTLFLSASSNPEHRDVHTFKEILGFKETFKHDLVMTAKRKRESSESGHQDPLVITGKRRTSQTKRPDSMVSTGKRKRDSKESSETECQGDMVVTGKRSKESSDTEGQDLFVKGSKETSETRHQG